MKWNVLRTVLLFGLASLIGGCYTQLSSGYDDYYNGSSKPYRERQNVRTEKYDEQVSTETEEQSTGSEVVEETEVVYADNIMVDRFPKYRRYFYYYQPSYAFSVSFCRYEPFWWYDPWWGWYDPCYPVIAYHPYWDYPHWNYGSGYWYGSGGGYAYNDNRYKTRTTNRVRGTGDRSPMNGRDLTRLSSVATRERADVALNRSREVVASGERTSLRGNRRGGSGEVFSRGASGIRTEGLNRTGRVSEDELSTRLRSREKETRTDNFKRETNRSTRLEDLDPSYGKRRQTDDNSSRSGRSTDAGSTRSTDSRDNSNRGNNTQSRESVGKSKDSQNSSSGRQQNNGGRQRESYSSPRSEGSSRGYSSPSSSGSSRSSSSSSSSRSSGSSNSGGSSRNRGR